ncbi:MAG: caspase family protein, partial [Myxococcales bacterium]|nr:caspase family protein [Myxococcales bacterium]
VYVYFSGHGAPDTETGDAYLVPYDANPAYIKTGGLPLADLQRTLGALKGQQVYLFLDACFSGQGDRSVLAQGTRPLVPVKALGVPTGLVTLAASAATETTGTHAGSGHGLFTYHLLAGLGGAADANGDHDVSLAELRDHLVEAVRVEARRQNRDQTPSVAVPPGVDVQAPVVQGLSQ